MKKLILIYSVILIAVTQTTGQGYYTDKPSGIVSCPSGCTVITISKGDSVFFGGNDDYIEPDSYYWVQPGDSSRYGVIWIGTPDNPQQGVNEKFLAYDANGLPRVDVNPHPERIPVPGEYHNYIMQIMHECSTVKEVIAWVNTHQRYPYMHDQLHFADATGDAVIISAGEDGEMVFTRKAPGKGYLVSTNFNVANPSNGSGYPCWRYDLASELMEQLIEREEHLSYQDATNVMDAVHVENGATWTIETMVADLVNGVVYIYYFYQYDRPLVLNVKYELSNPRDPGPLSRLFPEDVQQEAAKRYDKARVNLKINRLVGISWPALILVSLILFFTIRPEDKKGRGFWIIAVVILGPLALIVRFLTVKNSKKSYNRIAAIETLGNLMPLVISYTVALVILITSMLSGALAWRYQIIIMLGLPIFVSLVFHVAFLAPVRNRNFGRLIMQCIPRVLITTFIGLGGIIPIAMPLVNNSLYVSLISPLSPLAVMTWWAIVVLGALPGGLLIFIFERWEIKRSYRSWSVLTVSEEEFIIPPFKKIWWWILISIVILFAGIITGAVLAR
ncbi:MAG: hypothetical protein JW965_03135 [Bacteroidales bacterium]|nr:hypothetical protein [Bacteroidales bacterium]